MKKDNPDILKDFMGIFPNAASKEYCEKIIHQFDYIEKTHPTARGRIWTRREEEEVSPLFKENDTYFLGGDPCDRFPLEEEDIGILRHDVPLLQEFSKIIWQCYDKFAKKYGALPSLGLHKVSPSVRVQRYKPGEGYHIWHCDADNLLTSRRTLVVSLYLNTVTKGGETEFLYQSTRVSPAQGTLVLFPATWTHLHRGNPPLEKNKYLMTTWLEFVR